MKVADVMMRTPASCTADASVAAAVEILWNRNCGILPILSREGRVIGVVTDRDICIALGTRNRPAAELTVGEIQPAKLFTCRADDDIHTALGILAEQKIRRLPVVDTESKLQGILSLDDIVLHANASAAGRVPELSNNEVVEYMKRIYRSNEVASFRSAVA
jgi:CBS-domain-containing membrane protein